MPCRSRRRRRCSTTLTGSTSTTRRTLLRSSWSYSAFRRSRRRRNHRLLKQVVQLLVQVDGTGVVLQPTPKQIRKILAAINSALDEDDLAPDVANKLAGRLNFITFHHTVDARRTGEHSRSMRAHDAAATSATSLSTGLHSGTQVAVQALLADIQKGRVPLIDVVGAPSAVIYADAFYHKAGHFPMEVNIKHSTRARNGSPGRSPSAPGVSPATAGTGVQQGWPKILVSTPAASTTLGGCQTKSSRKWCIGTSCARTMELWPDLRHSSARLTFTSSFSSSWEGGRRECLAGRRCDEAPMGAGFERVLCEVRRASGSREVLGHAGDVNVPAGGLGYVLDEMPDPWLMSCRQKKQWRGDGTVPPPLHRGPPGLRSR